MSNWATRYTRAGPKPCCEGNTVSKKYGDYLNTEYWAKVSNLVKERAGWRCQICNSPHDLNAHHRTYEHRGDELRHLDDLIAMCRRCHAIFHGKLETTIVQVPAPPATVGKRAPKWSKGGPIDAEWVKASIPENKGVITLTIELVNRCRANGSFTNATLRGFGITKAEATKGWPIRLCGKQISEACYRAALEGRFQYNTGKLT